jgi:hypothetical protein
MCDSRTIEDLEREVASVPFEELMARYRQCAEGGHVWRPVAGKPLGPNEPQYCGWCLRARIGGFEAWLAAPKAG